jgi:hypothetical protein
MQFDIVANDKATPAMGKVEKSMDGFGKRVGAGFAMAAAKATMLLAAFSKISEFIGKQGDIADEAAKLGLSPELYQRLGFAAKEYGMDVSQVAMALKDVNTLLDKAATKSGPEMKALEALGFSQTDITDRLVSQQDVMARMAEVMKEARTEEEKFALATRMVGARVAQSIVPILSDYENFLKLQQQLTVVTNENAAAYDALGTKINTAGQNIGNFFSNLIGGYARQTGLIDETDLPKPDARTEEQRKRAQQMRDALLAADARDKKEQTDKVSGMAVTSLQAIGGGVARGASPLETYAERTAIATETIAAKTEETSPPMTGATDVTKPSQGVGSSFAKTMQDAGEKVGTAVINLFK